jgi:dihydrofolate synthase/folylpolyglutamate synthase
MTYKEAVAYLESLIDYERTPAGAAAARVWNLDRMRHMLHAVGDPHLGLRCLHLAGTKGKGSTAAMAASILAAADHRVGLYSKPHLISFRERVRVGRDLISEDDVTALTEELHPVIEATGSLDLGPPSFFEAYTLMGLLYFARQDVDIAVVETGLGGRLDATNVITPRACAITRVGFDHMQELGTTLAQIAREKAGIIKPGVPVISAPQAPEALEVFQEVALERGAQLLVVGTDAGPRILLTQVELAARDGLAVGEEAVRKGLGAVHWPGRFQVVRDRPMVVLDGAHNELGAAALADAIRSLLPGRRVVLILGIHRDKDADAIARHLCPLADRVIATADSNPRAMEAAELQRLVFRHSKHTFAVTPVGEAVRKAMGLAKRDDAIVITGSLYVVGEAMQALGVAEAE